MTERAWKRERKRFVGLDGEEVLSNEEDRFNFKMADDTLHKIQ